MKAAVRKANSRATQSGAVLFVAIVLLMILSLFAVVSANSSMVQNKLVNAERSAQLAQLAADSALTDAKVKISRAATDFGVANVCANLRCYSRRAGESMSSAEFIREAIARSESNAFRLQMTALKWADDTARLAAEPIYVIEDLGTASDSQGVTLIHSFRITAQGTGGVARNVRIAEGIYSIAE